MSYNIAASPTASAIAIRGNRLRACAVVSFRTLRSSTAFSHEAGELLNYKLGVTTRIVEARIPISPGNLGGQTVIADADSFEVLAQRDKIVLVEFIDLPAEISWFDTFELMYCQRQHDPGTIKVIRKATEEERKQFRVPLWIQDDDVPECCGRPMVFVGQIDDDTICMETPKDAKVWWHDKASFYVFTCSQCLESKTVGQQM